jgi:hypothetical protein
MQFVFGPGQLIVTPLSDAFGNAIATPSPRRLGGFQEGTFDSSAENKMLYGPNQMPIAVGRGKGKTGIKVKNAQFSVDIWNAIFIGQPLNQTNGIVSAFIDTVGTAIPTTPFHITPVTTYASYLQGTSPAYDYDLGVVDGNGNLFTRVTSVSASGEYSLAAGVYTFDSADAGTTVFISFAYTATNATGGRNAYVNVNNIAMGNAPLMQADFVAQYGGNTMFVTLFSSITSKLSFGTKLDDFSVPDMELDGFANSSNLIYRIAASQ